MICDACGRKYFKTSEQGIFAWYKANDARHYHLCKLCCTVVGRALKQVLLKGQAKHLPDKRSFK